MASPQLLEAQRLGQAFVAPCTQPVLASEAAQAVGDQLDRLISESGCLDLHLDLGTVDFLTAAVLGELVACHVRLRVLGGGIRLYNVSPSLHEVFQVVRLTEVLDIHQAKEVAIWMPGIGCPVQS